MSITLSTVKTPVVRLYVPPYTVPGVAGIVTLTVCVSGATYASGIALPRLAIGLNVNPSPKSYPEGTRSRSRISLWATVFPPPFIAAFAALRLTCALLMPTLLWSLLTNSVRLLSLPASGLNAFSAHVCPAGIVKSIAASKYVKSDAVPVSVTVPSSATAMVTPLLVPPENLGSMFAPVRVRLTLPLVPEIARTLSGPGVPLPSCVGSMLSVTFWMPAPLTQSS